MAKKNSFYFGFSPQQVEKLANKLGKAISRQDIQNLAKNYLIDLIEGEKILEPEAALKFRKLKAETEIAESKALYWKNFSKPPTHLANKAIKNKALSENSLRELTENEIDEIVKHITLENTFDGFRITCKHCRLETYYNDRLEALHEAARHLSAVHGEKILQK